MEPVKKASIKMQTPAQIAWKDVALLTRLTMSIRISQLSFEHHRTALGIGEAQPRISWRFDGSCSNWTQSGYALEVSRLGQPDVEVFRVGKSSDSILVPWPSVALSSGESASVRVKAFGANGQPDTPWSKAASVEAGLLHEQDWQDTAVIASTKPTNTSTPHQPTLFRKAFSVPGNIASARLYITAYGLYEAEINGQRIGDAVLAPGWQSYDHRLVYDTYDVTAQLRSGKNVIGAQVGEGWFSGRLGFDGGERNIWGDTIGLQALLVILTKDNKVIRVPTDLSWTASTGPIITSEIYNGEAYDSRLEQVGWSTQDFRPQSASKWVGVKALTSRNAVLTAPDGPPIRRVGEVQLQNVIITPSGKTVLDFGQNLVGWLRLQVSGPAGQTIKLTHVEVLENGEIATRPLRNATQTDYFTLSGKGTQSWEPKFTYHGFRYVQVEGWPKTTKLNAKAVTAIVVHSDMERNGDFSCSNGLLNKLHQNVIWSMRGNFMSLPTDCPQRDERLGWTGDAHTFAPTADYLYGTAGFWRGWLKDINAEQLTNGSDIPGIVVPLLPQTRVFSSATSIWGDVVVANPWNLYNAFGDSVMLKEQHAGAKAWIDSGIPRNGDGLWDRSARQFGDWLDPLAPYDNPGAATTNATYVSDAYLVYVTDLLAKISAALGLSSDAQYYQTWHANLTTIFQNTWLCPNGTSQYETQTGLTLPLYFSLFASPSHEEAAVKRLRSIIAKNNYFVGTGFAGTHLLGLALTKHNSSEDFYKMLLQTSVPSWLYQVVMGATTTWERWDSMLPNGTLNPGEMTSFNHYSIGSVANWMHQVIGGLAPAAPGWKRIQVRPVPGGGITNANATFLSPYGQVSSQWYVDADGLTLNVRVPPNTVADITLPASNKTASYTKTVGSGKYSFTVPGFTL